MQMQEPEQRSYQEGYEAEPWTNQEFTQNAAYLDAQEEPFQQPVQRQKIYPRDDRKRTPLIIGLIISATLPALFINGIVWSSIGISRAEGNPTILAGSIFGLVFSILLLVADLIVMTICIIALAMQQRNWKKARSIHVHQP